MKRYLVFLPNAITVLRMLLTGVFALLLVDWLSKGGNEVPYVMYLFYGFICLSDLIDGAAARRLKAQTGLGSILDILADSLFIFTSLIILNYYQLMPVWFTLVVFVNFLAFAVTSWFLWYKGNTRDRRFFIFDKLGRYAAVIFYLAPAAACLAFLYPGFRGWFHAMLYISVLLTALSFAKRSAHCLIS